MRLYMRTCLCAPVASRTRMLCVHITHMFIFSARYYTLSCIALIISSCRVCFLYVAFICTYDVGTKPSSPFDFRTRVQPSPKSFSMTSNVSPSTIATEPSFGAEKKTTFCYIQSVFCCVLWIYTCRWCKQSYYSKHIHIHETMHMTNIIIQQQHM